MMTKRELAKAYDAGQLESVAMELALYGVVEGHRWNDGNGNNGRVSMYTLHGRNWEVEIVNGEVVRVSWELI